LADTIYVDDGSGCTQGCGGSWQQPYRYLQDALGAAGSGDTIKVGQGAYYPDDGAGHTPDDRSETFHLKAGVTLEGGYAGYGAQNPDLRDIDTYVTILSGDVGTAQDPDDNSYHVVLGAGANDGATGALDGFVIQDGNASATDFGYNGAGAGYVSCGGAGEQACSGTPADDAPTIRNCTFRYNRAGGSSAGVHVRAPSLIERCTFHDNAVQGTNEAHGGALYACCDSDQSGPTIKNCVFHDNTASRWGGAVTVGDSYATFINCLFYDNQTTDNVNYPGGGGAMLLAARNGEDVSIINCTFASNRTEDDEDGVGGGILIDNVYILEYDGPDVDIDNCIFWGNADGTTNARELRQVIRVNGYGTLSMQYSDIEGCLSAGGGYCESAGDHNLGVDPMFADPGSDDYHLLRSSFCIDAGNNAANNESYDLDGNSRKRDVHCIPDTGAGSSPVIDLGSYEFQGGSIVYVDAAATGDDDGSSWEDAYDDLQEALEDARNTGSICEIRVGQGTYKPSPCTSCSDQDRQISFAMVDGASVYGGYAGVQGTVPDARDVALYETVFSGNIGGAGPSDNSYHVVTAGDDVTTATALDGFTITLGRADYNSQVEHPLALGGGLYSTEGELQIESCRFTDNSASWRGGAAYILADLYGDGDATRFSNCVFEDNTAVHNGGALLLARARAQLLACRFTSNEVTGTCDDCGGGAVSLSPGYNNPDADDATFRRCTFASNTVQKRGGAVSVHTNTFQPPQFYNCLFYRNEADDDSSGGEGGAIWSERPLYVENCTFGLNRSGAADSGGGIYLKPYSSSTTLYNTILWKNKSDGNHDVEEDQIYYTGSGITVTATYCCVHHLDGLAGEGNTGNDPLYADADGDEYWLLPTSCGGGNCVSRSIDRGEGEIGEPICLNQTDVDGDTRCVDLDDLDEDIDMGAEETPDEG